MRATLGDRVFDYVRDNPGSRYPQVSDGLGLSRDHARACLARLERQGRLASKKTGTHARAYYPSSEQAVTDSVLSYARCVGGHFGILVAQVAR